jgi:hypothetical protein
MRMRQLARASGIAKSNGKHAERFRVSACLDAEPEFGIELSEQRLVALRLRHGKKSGFGGFSLVGR